MSERIERLTDKVRPQKYPICTEMAWLITESYKATPEDPEVIRTSKALANMLDNITILIDDDDLFVGNLASKPMGVEVRAPVSWSQSSIDGFRADGWDISAEEEAQINSMSDYWGRRSPVLKAVKLYSDELFSYGQTGVILPPWTSRDKAPGGGTASAGFGFGLGPELMSVNYKKILKTGLNKVIEEAEQEFKKINYWEADSVQKAYFLQAAITTNKAVIKFANRFAVLAEEMAKKEKDPARKKELQRIAATCQWVPANPARSFFEAIQFYWFLFGVIFISGTTPMGRFDQFMYPYYKKDIEEGKITDEEVLELLQFLRIKDMQFNTTFGNKVQREKWAGLAKWNNMVIGGQTPEGRDATNELTYLVLEAVKRCPTPHHTVTLRVHEGTPEPLMLKALELVKMGIGMPAFVSDKSYIEYMLSKGVPLDKARDYSIIGCLDGNVEEGCANLYGMFIAPLVFDIFMHNGVLPRTGMQVGPKTGDVEKFKTFEEFKDAFKEQLAFGMRKQVEALHIDYKVYKGLYPDSLTASLMTGGIQRGKSRVDSALPYQLGQTICTVGLMNVADSLAAVKKLVYEEKKVTMKELKAALAANWQGNGNSEMRKMFLAAPKYGNDDDYVDSIASELFKFYADYAGTLEGPRGVKYSVGGVSITAHGPGGAITGATPDGRYAGENLADGTTSPVQGRDTHGPIAVIKSAAKLDQSLYQSTLMNMKFHPSALKTQADLNKLSSLIRTYFSMGGKHLQFNVVDKKILIEAQKKPEQYRDLIVRVAGYSAYYTQLTKTIQDDIISRMEYEKTA
jgi:pyruvate formate-lyase/glycerol dehydratase family glycyl radical enzyme